MKVLANWNVSEIERQIIADSWPHDSDVAFTHPREPDATSQAPPDREQVQVIVGGAGADLIAKCTSLKLVQTLGHGIDGVLKHRDALLKRGITVARANPASINISEFVLMCMVALSRRVIKMHNALVAEGSWSPERKAGRMIGTLGGELFGATLGLLGFGSIGVEVARRAKAFGMEVAVCVRDPKRIRDEAHLVNYSVPASRIDEFLARCDYVVISMPLTDESRGLFSRERFAAMRKGSYLINISRGPIVDERSLYESLRDGHLAGAASDVWTVEETGGKEEYPLPFPIHQYNVIMTPHYCGATKQSRERAIQIAGENIRRLMEGRDLLNVADLAIGY